MKKSALRGCKSYAALLWAPSCKRAARDHPQLALGRCSTNEKTTTARTWESYGCVALRAQLQRSEWRIDSLGEMRYLKIGVLGERRVCFVAARRKTVYAALFQLLGFRR